MDAVTHDEREALARTFLDLGPHAPTILPGWDAESLLEHLQWRERGAHLTLAERLPGAAGRRAAAVRDAWREQPWGRRVETFRAGPHRLSPVGALDAFSGQGELLIHHEDLRRAQPDWQVRRLSAEAAADAWRALRLMAPLSLSVRADLTLVSPLGGHRVRSRRAAGSLRVHGEPLDLLLWVSGRDEVARVRIHGDEPALRALREGRRRL